MYYLDFCFKTKVLSRNKLYNFYEIRLLYNKKVLYILGFFDFVNKFIFLNFQKFFYYFFLFNISFKTFFSSYFMFDFLFFLFSSHKFYLEKLNRKFYMIDTKYYVFFKKINKVIRKLFLKKLEREIKGFSWGKLLLKQSKVISKIDNERALLF